jgi:putative oxidoreductase
MNALRLLLKTNNDPILLFLRLLLAAVMFPHGAQKALGWWGGYGFTGTMNFFTQSMHIPAPLAFLAIAAEFAGPVALVLGLTTRVAAFGIAANMLVAALTSHLANGFFMNWFGNQKGEGFEYHLLAGAIALTVVIRGGGNMALDRAIYDRVAGGESKTTSCAAAPACCAA